MEKKLGYNESFRTNMLAEECFKRLELEKNTTINLNTAKQILAQDPSKKYIFWPSSTGNGYSILTREGLKSGAMRLSSREFIDLANLLEKLRNQL